MPFYPPPGSPSRHLASVDGPSNYQAGGFVVDLTHVFTSVEFFDIVMEVAGLLPPVRYEIARNSPSPGKVTVKLLRIRFNSLLSIGNVTGQSGSVSVVTSGGQAASVNAIGGVGTAERENQLYQHQHGFSVAANDTFLTEVVVGTNLSATRFRYNAIGT